MKIDTEEIVDENKINQPKERKAKVCLWCDLSVNDIDEIYSVWGNTTTVKTLLKRIFQIDDSETSPILVDLYYYTLLFAKENSFNTEQTSAFFSMVKQTHEMCTETPFENFDYCFKHFKEQLLCHAVKRPPYSLDLYDAQQVKLISEYVVGSYFRHYKMYKYAFTPTVRVDLRIKYTGLPETPAPSEAGDQAEDTTEPEEEPKEEVAEQEEESKPEVVEESEAAKQLRNVIKQHLEEEINKLRLSMETHLKTTEENLNQKLTNAEGGKAAKGGRGSAKSKKK